MAEKQQDKMAWFPLYVYAFITDVAGWKNNEVGAYIRLLCYQWINKELPVDEEELARMIQEPPAEFRKIWIKIKCKFELKNFAYKNPKLEVVREEQKKKLEKNTRAGEKGAATRWGLIMFPFNKDTFQQHWDKWLEYKKATFKFKYKTPVSEQNAIDKLHQLSNGDEAIALAIMNESIANQWQGFFPLKGQAKKQAEKFTGRQDFGK